MIRRLFTIALLTYFSCAVARANPTELTPAVDRILDEFHIARVKHEQEAPASARSTRSFTFDTKLQVPSGDRYVILTDVSDELYQPAIQKLAKAHSAEVINVGNFRSLIDKPNACKKLLEQLQKAKPKFVAIIPAPESFSENVVLALWQVLAEFGGGTINVYPSFLVPFDPDSFQHLIDESVAAKPAGLPSMTPFVIAQSTKASAGGVRAVQKALIMHSIFDKLGGNSKGLIVRTPTAFNDDVAEAPSFAIMDAPATGKLVSLPAEQEAAINDSRLLLLFGHGVPGMTCSIDVSAFRRLNFDNDIVLCGSCFSAVPAFSDLPSVKATRGKHSLPFVRRAIANGAKVFYGNMNENGGFPEMFVVFDSMLKGETLGQSYQRLINANLGDSDLPVDRLVMTNEQLALPQAIKRRSSLLYIVIGDPALQPIAVP